ncbi:hypothetical protein [Beijerinckia indica]|uniref:Uncharacterized protein n=1 Tax=Beijerinckia indica subsp. indica (strain ATCC 9039 / DSM 1715 / NCIMB 8712) TaxID=395963 RepID=B2IFT0_BEII9|nr:hypothetical protein [Beijerinckia indica]ACB94291.1 conserved hypothetical protein [Beijerinckia indica subsp. indica ATCC 9039]
MSTYSFGSGILYGLRTDSPNATPINFGLIQDVSIDETPTIKELYGQNQRPVAIARGTIKTTGKATLARISGLAMASLFYGVSPSAGQLATQFQEPSSVPSDPQIGLSVSNAATFADDYGIIFAASGLPLTKVASNPTAGQYSLSDNKYLFASDDAGKAILITYTYELAGIGQSIHVQNQLLGTTPIFQCQFYTTFNGQSVSLKLNACTASKFSFATKLEDFTMPDFEFSCFADAAGNVMTWSFSEVS